MRHCSGLFLKNLTMGNLIKKPKKPSNSTNSASSGVSGVSGISSKTEKIKKEKKLKTKEIKKKKPSKVVKKVAEKPKNVKQPEKLKKFNMHSKILNVKEFIKKDKEEIAINVLMLKKNKNVQLSTLKKVQNVLTEMFYEYTDITKINGMFYLRKFVTKGLQRLLWCFFLTSYLTLGITLVFLLWKRYLDSPTRTTIASPKTTLEVAFPAVTICHPQSVIDYKAEEFVNKMFGSYFHYF